MSPEPSVVVVSGHMVDAPDRPQPRFPPEEIPRVTGEVKAALGLWDVGPGTTLVTGGARGADIIAAELARARGARVRLVLALEPDELAARSVALPGTDWEARFHALLAHADIEVVDGPDDEYVFERANDRIVEVARELDERPHAVIVWDGTEGDGPGGTEHFVARLGQRMDSDRVVLIDPRPRP
jgi:hypothetical protein